MQFSNFSRIDEGLTITLFNEIPIENVGTLKFYKDNKSGSFNKIEIRWSFNKESWSSWATLTQNTISSINTYSNYYLFFQIRYVLSAINSGNVTTFTLDYLNGNATPYNPRILINDIEHQDSSAVLIHDILQTYEVIKIYDASLLSGFSINYILNRANHTGKQPIVSITGLQNILNSIDYNINDLSTNTSYWKYYVDSSYIPNTSIGNSSTHTVYWNNGYLEASTGVQGIQGLQGTQGIQGIQGT
ncbi:hypothetical protein M0Q50_10545, partial [bacterium]|nr:hypothetical protein [bacterium]